MPGASSGWPPEPRDRAVLTLASEVLSNAQLILQQLADISDAATLRRQHRLAVRSESIDAFTQDMKAQPNIFACAKRMG